MFDQFGAALQRAQRVAVVHEIEVHWLTRSNRIRLQAGGLTRKRHIVIGVRRLHVLDRIEAVAVAQQIGGGRIDRIEAGQLAGRRLAAARMFGRINVE